VDACPLLAGHLLSRACAERRYHAGMTTPAPEPTAPGAPPSAYQGAPGDAVESARRPLRVWDIVLTIVLLVADVALAAVASFMGVFLAMASDPCGARDCNFDLITAGFFVGTIGPWVALTLTLAAAIVLLVLRRIAFWVPLAGAALIVLVMVAAFGLAGAGVP